MLALIESTFPTASLFYDFANDEDNVSFAPLGDDSFRDAVHTFFAALNQTGRDDETIISIMQSAEPFQSRWTETLKLLGFGE